MPLMRGRELKLENLQSLMILNGMPLMRGRELKQPDHPKGGRCLGCPLCGGENWNWKLMLYGSFIYKDAPYAGARIETFSKTRKSKVDLDAPYAGARIETLIHSLYIHLVYRCPLCGGENWNNLLYQVFVASALMPLMRGRELKQSNSFAHTV